MRSRRYRLPIALRVRSKARRGSGAEPAAGGVSGADPGGARPGGWRRTRGSHHRRLRVGEESTKNREQPSPAQRRTATERSARVAAAERAIASRGESGRAGTKCRRHSPETRTRRWLPAHPLSSSLIAAMDPAGGCEPACRASASAVSRPRSLRSASWGGPRSTWSNRCVTVQRAKAAASGRRSGGLGVRPSAELTKSSQTASPSRVNSGCSIA